MIRNLATRALLHGTRILETTSASSAATRAVFASNKKSVATVAAAASNVYVKSFTNSPSKRQFSSSNKNINVVGPIMTADGLKNLGIVKWFDYKKGFGFIIPNDGSGDLFVHFSDLHCESFRSLRDGEEVEFIVTENEKGQRCAKDVTGPNGSYCVGSLKK